MDSRRTKEEENWSAEGTHILRLLLEQRAREKNSIGNRCEGFHDIEMGRGRGFCEAARERRDEHARAT
jgi:hypothetical protein